MVLYTLCGLAEHMVWTNRSAAAKGDMNGHPQRDGNVNCIVPPVRLSVCRLSLPMERYDMLVLAAVRRGCAKIILFIHILNAVSTVLKMQCGA